MCEREISLHEKPEVNLLEPPRYTVIETFGFASVLSYSHCFLRKEYWKKSFSGHM
jgi:hypothetical protein